MFRFVFRQALVGAALIALLSLAACGESTANTVPPTAPTATTMPVIVPTDTSAPVEQPTVAPALTDTVVAGPTDTPLVLATVTPVPAPPTDTAAPAPTAPPAPPPTDTVAPPPPPAAPTDTPVARSLGAWQKAALDMTNLRALAAGPGATVYAGGDGVFRSTDGGLTWTALTRDFRVTRIAVAPSDPRVVYAGTGLGCASGIGGAYYRSSDSGATWTPITGEPVDLAVSPRDPNSLLGIECAGLRRSADGGATWAAIPGTGILDLDGALVAWAPSNPSYIYTVYVSEGGTAAVQRSTDGGQTWTVPAGESLFGPADFVIDPKDARHTYFVGGSGFFSSANAGDLWNRHDDGLSGAEAATGGYYYLSNLTLDTVSPPPAGATASLYVGTFGDETIKPLGVLRWNGNTAWEPLAPAPDGQSIRRLLMVNDSAGPALIAATDVGIYRWALR